MATEQQKEQTKQLKRELKKIYEKLKDSPEKGENNVSFVAWAPPSGIPGQSDFKPGEYIPGQADWVDQELGIFEASANISPHLFIKSRLAYYGFGPSVGYVVADSGADPSYERWYLQTKTFLSEDEKYYIVPVAYEKIIKNKALKHFFTDENKLKIYGEGGLLGGGAKSKVFLNSAKIWALEKLAVDLAKSINQNHKKEAEKVGFLPVDSPSPTKKDGLMAEAWYVDARPPEYQNLFLKVMFDKNWADTLPPQLTPCLGETSRTVMLFIKDLERDLRNLEQILYIFNDRIQDARAQVDFDALCYGGKVPKIPELLNKFLAKNGKPEMSTKSKGALQLGFTESMDLQYIAYSEEPDCLCDESNIDAYILQKGAEELKKTPPFDSQTNNGFLFYLPELMRKYSSYLDGSRSKYLFAAQESWLRFVQTYVYPKPDVVFDTESGTYADYWAKKIADFGVAVKATAGIARAAPFIGDPTLVLAPDVRKTILGATKTETAYTGDDIMLKAVTSEILNLKTLYQRLLHKVPVMEMVKLATAAIVKCTADGKLKKELCKTILKTMPTVEIETRLIPCLQQSGDAGLLAIASLRGTMTDRQDNVYAQVKARYPEKFPASSGMKTEAEKAAVNDLYCNDPTLQQSLGRAPDDMSEELLLWLENQSHDVICDCILTVYGPAQQLLGFIEETKDDVLNIMDMVGQNKARTIESTTTFSFAPLIRPCEETDDHIKSFGDELLDALKKLIAQLILAAVLVVLNHVKSSIMGGLLRDMCNAVKKPWALLDITDMIMSSPLYEDRSFLDLKKTLEKLKNLSGLSGDINNLYDAIKELGKGYSPSEMKRLFTTDCGDNSYDASFANAYAIFAENGITVPAVANSVFAAATSPTDAAILAESTLSASDLESADHDPLSIPPFCPAPPGAVTAMKDFCAGVGNLIDATLWDEAQEKWDDANSKFADLCDPNTISVLSDTLDEETVTKLAEKDQNELIKDITNILPLLDANRLEEMMPPLFCGPCSPQKVGQEPLMSSQTHPTQLHLLSQFNKNLFKGASKVFNVDIGSYKTIMLARTDNQTNYAATKRELAAEHMPSKAELDKMTDVEKMDAIAKANQTINAKLIMLLATDAEEGENKFVARGLLNALKKGVTNNHAVTIEDEPEYRLFIYDIPESANQILLSFNFSDRAVTTQAIKTEALQMKIVVRNYNGTIEYEWPDPASPDMHHLKDFNENDLTTGFFKHIGEKIPAMNSMSAMPSAAPGQSFDAESTLLTQHYPLIINLIFETIATQATQRDLFKSAVFNKIPLTDEETKVFCGDGPGQQSLFDVEKLADDVAKAQTALECVVSMFATPDAPQIAQMYGMYKLIVKICIIEEYLKNIFAFGFVRMADILETDAYKSLITSNVVDTIQTSMGSDGYDNLLDYSSKIINGRQQLGEEFVSTPLISGPLGPIEEIRPPEECLGILVTEAAREINDIFDDRIQNIPDIEWVRKFYTYEDIDTPQTQRVLESRLWESAVLPDYWSPNVFPYEHASTSDSLDSLSAMRYLGQKDDGHWAWGTAEDNLLEKQSIWPYGGNWGGGLFFQPYIQLKSKLEVEGDLDEEGITEAGLNKFWTKFKNAAAQKDAFEAFDTDGWPSSPDENNFASNAIGAMINKIDGEKAPEGTLLKDCPTFKKFWDLLFNPRETVVQNALPAVVSSFVPRHFDFSPGQEYDAYYYWQNKNSGAPDDKKYHWLNRGVTSIDFAATLGQEAEVAARVAAVTADVTHKLEWLSPKTNPHSYHLPVPSRTGAPYYPPELNKLGQLNSAPIATIPDDMLYSNLDIFALSKEISIGSGWSTKQNVFLNSLISFLYNDLGREATNSDQEGYDYESFEEEPAWMPKQYYYGDAAAFYNRVRDIIFDSPYDTWFDITLGMRLNLIFPIDQDAESGIFSVAQALMDSNDFNKYNKEKMFVWEKSPGDRYLCLPIESVEHDYDYGEEASDFWVYVNNAVANLSYQTYPGISPTSNLGLVFSPQGSGTTPTLWAISRALATELYHNKDKILGTLRKELQNKIFGAEDDQEANKFLNEILPIKQLVIITTFMYRYYMESAYPELNNLFDGTKQTLGSAAMIMLKTIEGDYEAIDDLDASLGPDVDGFSDEDIWKKFLLLTVQMMANMTDPTWTKPWFLPGPLTPIGVVAKLIATKWNEDDDDAGAPEDVCPQLPDWWGTEDAEGKEGEPESVPSAIPLSAADQELVNMWKEQMAAGNPPPTYDGFTNSPLAHTEDIPYAGKLPFLDDDAYNGRGTPIWVPYDMLTKEGQKRQWQYYMALQFGFPNPPPFYTKYNIVSWMAGNNGTYCGQMGFAIAQDCDPEIGPADWEESCWWAKYSHEGGKESDVGFSVPVWYLKSDERNTMRYGCPENCYIPSEQNKAWYYYLYGFAGGTGWSYGHEGSVNSYEINRFPNLFAPSDWTPDYNDTGVSWAANREQSKVVEYYMLDPAVLVEVAASGITSKPIPT